MTNRTYRVRDPVHGLIAFREGDPVDQLAWALLNGAEFQRLRRIKQLGVSEFVFPGATHTRFAHCIGVFHTARQLVVLIRRELRGQSDVYREKVAVIAALLHDIGHGPFSHAFENAYDAIKKGIDPKAPRKSHEEWTSEIILNQAGNIRPLLDEFAKTDCKGRPFAEDVAALLDADIPADIYHAVVSSSFDADRLDYMRRDRMMTGAGAIDFDWLLDNLAVEDIDPETDGESSGVMKTPSFCLRERALQAAESFILARWHLYCQVYLHKTTRCVEGMIQALMTRFAQLVDANQVQLTGVSKKNSLAVFFARKSDTLPNYLRLDDTVVWAAIADMRSADDQSLRDLARRILDRDLYKVLDCDSSLSDKEPRRRKIKKVREAMQNAAQFSILEDSVEMSAYGEIKADQIMPHKRLMIVDTLGGLKEVTERSDVVKAISNRTFSRFFFSDEAIRDGYKTTGGLNGS